MLLAPLALAALVFPPPAVAPRDSAAVPACEAVAATVAAADRLPDVVAALTAHRGAVRWAADGQPVRVWIQRRPTDGASLSHGEHEWRDAVVAAATAWTGSVPGLRVTIVRDSAAADVHVRWTPVLQPSAIGDPAAGSLAADGATGTALAPFTAGRTTLVPDATGRAVRAEVVLAAGSLDGAPYLPRDVHAIAQHEMGHVLGLAHHRSSTSVMSQLIAVDRVADDDRAVLRALYALPIGAPCAPR